MRSSNGETKLVQELILYAASAALSCLVLFVGLKQLDPNRESSKKALEQKKEIAKRLGRPLIQTNSYEVHFFFHFPVVIDVCFLLILTYYLFQFLFGFTFGNYLGLELSVEVMRCKNNS